MRLVCHDPARRYLSSVFIGCDLYFLTPLLAVAGRVRVPASILARVLDVIDHQDVDGSPS